MLSTKDKVKLIGVALGIIITYSLMNIVVEKLFKSDYGGDKFVYPVAYNVIQCIVPTIIAKGILIQI